MVMHCAFCGQRAKKTEEGSRTFHKFPLKHPEILQAWVKNMGMGCNFVPSESMRLCSDHFSNECFRKAGVNVTLLEGSAPTLFAEHKFECFYCKVIKTREDHRTYHKFPVRNPIQLKKWLAGMGLDNFSPSDKSVICSDHFERTCFRPSGYGDSLRLKNNAVPSIFMPLTTEGGKRRHSSPELPAAKFRRVENEPRPGCSHHSMEEPALPNTAFEEIPSPNVRLAPNSSKQPTTPNTSRCIRYTQHDHHYENTPGTMRTQLISSKKKIEVLQKEARVHKQRICRLQKKIVSLKDIVSELRRTRALSDSGLACLDSIADTDVSQLLKRYIKNQKNVGKDQPTF